MCTAMEALYRISKEFMTISIADKMVVTGAVALVSAVIEIVWKPIGKSVVPVIKKWLEDKLRRGQTKVYSDKAAIATILLAMENIEGIVSAVQLQTKNGGGIPKPGSPLYASVVAPVKYSTDFTNQLLDGPYCTLIAELIDKKRIYVSTDGLAEDSILKLLCNAHGINGQVWFDMAITKTEYNFISVNLKVPYDELTAVAKNEIRANINTIYTIIHG